MNKVTNLPGPINVALLSFSLCLASCTDDSVADDTSQAGSTGETGAPDENAGETGGSSDPDTGDPPPDMGTPDDPNEQIPPPDEEGCHAIYAQDLLPTFELTVHPVVWEALEDEWNNGQANEDAEIDPNPYHPLAEFRYGDIVIKDAEIRLRGNPSHWDPLPEDKMQFQIGFHRNDPENGHFLGLKRLGFDSHTYNRHLLRDRLGLAVMRDVGIPAPCANNARLVVNGEYYGIFTNLEKQDEVYVERVFAADPTGDLWKRQNWELKTNEDTSNEQRLDALLDAGSLEEIETYLHVEQALRVFAAEAVLPNSDGPWAGGLNFYLYDDPLIGKFWLLPTDLDQTFERFNGEPGDDFPANPDPVVWEKEGSHGRHWYDLPLEDPVWFELYIDLIDEVLHDGYIPEKMHARIDEWTAQIQDAVFEDVNKPYDNELYLDKVEELHDYVDARYQFVDEWLECWQDGGVDDGDGYCEAP